MFHEGVTPQAAGGRVALRRGQHAHWCRPAPSGEACRTEEVLEVPTALQGHSERALNSQSINKCMARAFFLMDETPLTFWST